MSLILPGVPSNPGMPGGPGGPGGHLLFTLQTHWPGACRATLAFTADCLNCLPRYSLLKKSCYSSLNSNSFYHIFRFLKFLRI